MSDPAAIAPSRSLSPREWLAVAIGSLAVMLPKALFARQRGFWLDEYYTLNAAAMPLAEMWSERLGAGHSPLPFLYARLFHVLLGDGELALKLSSILAAGAAVVALAGVTAALGLKRLLPLVLLAAIVQPYWQHIGTEFRYTMPLVTIGGFATWALVLWLRDGRLTGAIATLALTALALWWHGSAQFIVLAMVIAACLAVKWGATRWPRGAAAYARAVAPLVAAFLLSLPLLWLISIHKPSDEGGGGGTAVPSIRLAVTNQVKTFLGEDRLLSVVTGLGDDVFGLSMVALHLAALTALWRRFRRGATANPLALAIILGLLVGLPLGIAVYTGLAKSVQGPERYVAFASFLIVILYAFAWDDSTQWRRWQRNAFRGLLAALGLSSATLHLLNQGDWQRESARYVAAERLATEPVITMGRAMNLVSLRRYGMNQEGFVDGIRSDGRLSAELDAMLRQAGADADGLWLFLYRPGKTPVGDVLGALEREGWLVGMRRWDRSSEMTVIYLARTAAGAARMAELPEIPAPWLSDNPPKRTR